MTEIMRDIDACVFDAYGTVLDFAAAAAKFKDELGDKEKQLSDIWRVRQLEYTWLRSLMGEYVPFWQVTQEALDYALAVLEIDDKDLRQKLLDVYFTLDAFPEVPAMLGKLKAGGMRTAILSNGSVDMLNAAVDGNGLTDLLDEVFSVDSVKIFKPHPKVYQMVPDTFDIDTRRVCFLSSNAWDAAAAANFGFRVVWVNRYGQ
ncbi:MAG: haloacid dehalogenase type II, partial [Magnetovibrio sp.]|nr:haloacid dehalogenase type II [Magnetovibrio sp.]